MSKILRRQILLASVAILVVPSVVLAQPPKVWRIGFLASTTRQSLVDSGRYAAFIEGMRELGYVEGRNFVMEAHFADGKSEQLSGLATDLARRKVDVIVIAGTDAARAAQRATTSIPIVLATAGDPISSGLAASLARPGGNITGNSMIATDLGPKHVELLTLAVPRLSRFAILLNPNNGAHPALLGTVLQFSSTKF